MYKYLALLLLILAACDTYVEDKRSVDFEPIYLPDSEEEDKGSDLGTIYQQNKGNLFAMEARAHRVGDILTVSFTESFQATKSQNAASSRSSENSLTLPTVMKKLPVIGKGIPEAAELASSGESTFSGSGSSNQSNSLTGLISVHVVRVFSNGNLEILGQKKLTLNNGDEYIRVSGIVRPRDISSEIASLFSACSVPSFSSDDSVSVFLLFLLPNFEKSPPFFAGLSSVGESV